MTTIDYVELADQALDNCQARAEITRAYIETIAGEFFPGELLTDHAKDMAFIITQTRSI
jgi:hypothetical protein